MISDGGGGGDWKDLVKAAREGNIPLIQYHLRQGVDPDFQHPEYFTCPIFEAVRNGNLEAVKVLIEEGKADPNIIEHFAEQTPIEAALEAQQYPIVKYLNAIVPVESRYRFRNVLVTGGNRGIGKAIVEGLLLKGHAVTFVCRRPEDGESVKTELAAATKNENVDFIIGDLTCIQSTLELAKAIRSRFPSMDVLIHNAGLWPTEKKLNEDGLEVSFCINYLAPYLLTRELTPLLQKNGPDSRIIFVSGKIYVLGAADIGTTPFGKDFSRFKTYMHTKQCGVILFLNTAQQLQDKGIVVNAVHPGVIRTGLGEAADSDCCTKLLFRVLKSFWKQPKDGAVGPVWLADSEEAGRVHGNYYDGMALDTMSESVTSLPVQRDWEHWTIDFLKSRRTGSQNVSARL